MAHDATMYVAFILCLANSFISLALNTDTPTIIVEGSALDFATNEKIPFANINWIEKNYNFTSDSNGDFTLPSDNLSMGDNITLFLFNTTHNKSEFYPTQTNTITITPDMYNISGPQHNIVIQTPTVEAFQLLNAATGFHTKSNFCHLVVTVTGPCLTLNNHPQGEQGATTHVEPPFNGDGPFYFGAGRQNKTDPFSRGLNVTSFDGGVLWFNAPLGEYTVSAQKRAVVFDDPAVSVLKCVVADGRLLNAAPPWGPRVECKSDMHKPMFLY